MSKIPAWIFIISIIVNFMGLFICYRFFETKKALKFRLQGFNTSNKSIDYLAGLLDKVYPYKMIFLHHSVGQGILIQGGLRDSLLEMGIFVRGATYGDEIGEQTDMCNWLPKFQDNMKQILGFKYHSNNYYSDDESNDIVMFKSCFPNSDITEEGSLPGDPFSRIRTLANYKATFEGLKEVIQRYPEKLFIYLTAPPLVRESTTPGNAGRAREFNAWLMREFLPRYGQELGVNNFFIFDLFDLLADKDNCLKQEFRQKNKNDSHPNLLANQTAATKLMEFLRPIWSAWTNRQNTQPTGT